MTRFGIDVNDAAVRDALADLEDEYTTERVEVVGTNVEYSIFWSSGLRICRRILGSGQPFESSA